jgi:tetratricopeptide (TPR) repeat protein
MNEGAAWFRRALDADTDAPRELRAQALHWLGVMLDEQRDERGAIDRLEEALAIQREIGDERLIARELNSLGAVHRNIGEQGSARSLLMESLARRRRLGDMAGVATVLTNLGIVALDRGDPDSAIEPLEEALAIDRASGATGGSAYSSIALGTAYLRTGRRDESIDLLRSALAVFHDLDDTDGVAEGLERLGEAFSVDQPARAARLLLAASSIRERERVGLRAIDEAKAAELIANVTRSLTQVDLDAALADANAMDVDAAAVYALAIRG